MGMFRYGTRVRSAYIYDRKRDDEAKQRAQWRFEDRTQENHK